MSFHLNAQPEEIAETVLLPGDPLRAKWIAETYFENPVRYNEVRGMLGYTGNYQGKRVSVQGTGMGMGSILIYVQELIKDYGAKQLIRVGSAGSYQPELSLREIVLALSASYTSSFLKNHFGSASYAPTVNPDLLLKAHQFALQNHIPLKMGNVLSQEVFYNDDEQEITQKWAAYGTLAVEMETAALYTLAAKFRVKALSLLTITDIMLTGEQIALEEKEKSLDQMVEIALSLV